MASKEAAYNRRSGEAALARYIAEILSERFARFIVRDDFNQKTKSLIAGKAGYRCSNPECRTIGSDAAQTGITNLGVAAHVTAAAAGGPRFEPTLTPEERCHESNGSGYA